MAEFYCYEGIRNGATFKVAAATKSKLDKPSDLNGKVVTLTGNYEVGFGSAGDRPLGFVEMTEYEANDPSVLVCSVVFNQAREDIPCAGSETAGDYLACDGEGGLALSGTSTAAIVSNAVAWGVDATAKTCTVYIHG